MQVNEIELPVQDLNDIDPYLTPKNHQQPDCFFDGKRVEASEQNETAQTIRNTYSGRNKQRIEDLFQKVDVNNIEPSSEESFRWDRLFSSCYSSVTKLWEWICSPSKLDLDPKLADNKLPQIHGVNGLSNHHGTCYLNTTLQLLAQTVRIHLEQGNCTENSENCKMMEVISEKMPTLMNLVNRTPMKERDLKSLYQEAARIVSEEKMYSFLSCRKISSNQLETGYATGGVPAHYLHTLLSALNVPPLRFSITNCYRGEHYNNTEKTECTTNLYYQKAALFNDAFQNETSIASSLGSLAPDCLNMLIVDSDQHEIKDMLKPISFSLEAESHENSSPVSYEPVMISVEPKNAPHTYLFLKKEGSWFEVNDNRVFAIPPEWEQDLEKFCGQYARLITYQKTEKNTSTSDNQPQNLPSKNLSTNVSDQLKSNGIDIVDRALYSVVGCPESFFTSHATSWT